MKDTTNRMVMGQLDTDLDEKIQQAEKREEATKAAQQVVVNNISELPPLDLNLEDFFFTGNIQHTFKIGNNFSFVLRLPASDEVAKLHRDLYATVKSESEVITDAEFDIRRVNGIVALSLMKYGTTNLENETKEKRLEFVNKLPAVVVQTLSKCYVHLENSASALLDKESNQIKN